MNLKKAILISSFIFSIIFLGTGITFYLVPLNYITINDVRQVATPENTRAFRLVFLYVFGGIGLLSGIAGVAMAVKWKN